MKRKSFEETIQADFRWPVAGDMPFVEERSGFFNASIAAESNMRLVQMMDGYRKAADLMVRYSQENDSDRDFLVCPIIFNYRQFLELSLKYLIATYGLHVGISAIWNTHDLQILWSRFLQLLKEFGTPDPDDADSIVGEVIAEFAKIDPGSYSYRYPVDRSGKPLPLSITDLHLPTLADVMNGVSSYFEGCDGYLGSLVNAAQ